jgi:hypothetical protein
MTSTDPDFKSGVMEYIRYWLRRFSELTQIDAELIDMTIDTYHTKISRHQPMELFVPITRPDQIRPGVQVVTRPTLRVHRREFTPLIVFDVTPDRKLKLVHNVVDEFPITAEEKTRFDEIKDKLSSFLEELVRFVVAELVMMAVFRMS